MEVGDPKNWQFGKENEVGLGFGLGPTGELWAHGRAGSDSVAPASRDGGVNGQLKPGFGADR
jgi:hypothetical protein